ncbi:MAG: hypothetical protein WC099_00625 [Candidatus Paceibacterota bacterium]
MSEELKNISAVVMEKISHNKIKMRSKIYFVVGSISTFVGLVGSVVLSVFLVGFIRFSIRTHRPMGGYRFDRMMELFPWWAPILILGSFVLGIWLLRMYDFSFKKNFKLIAGGFIVAIIIGGFIIDTLGLMTFLARRGPIRGLMKPYIQQDMPQDEFRRMRN